jgi:hypothetical protein
VITKLLDRWWDHQTKVAQRRPRRLPVDLSIPVAGYPNCACGHVADVHRHYRDGNDCSQCTCRSYNNRRTS